MDSVVDDLQPPRLPARGFSLGSIAIACACIGAALAVGCDRIRLRSTGGITTADTAIDDFAGASDAARFDRLYKTNCAGCHGADGKLGPAPPLNDPIFLAIISDEELARVIQNGRRGTPMPAFGESKGGSLNPFQVVSLAEGIKHRWKPAQATPPTLLAYALAQRVAALPTVEAAEAGVKVFARACANCHGTDGKGDPGDSQPNAIHEPNFLALISDQALRRIVITGRADLGMPDFAGKNGRSVDFQPLDSQDIANLVALLSSWRAAESTPGVGPAKK
jgi:mono/diheme cytochrome c family protein